MSTTGTGETFLKYMVAKRIIDYLEKEELNGNFSKLVRKVLDEMVEKVGGEGGAICLSKSGEIGIEWNTKRMSWAYVKSHELVIHLGCHRDQHLTEKF